MSRVQSVNKGPIDILPKVSGATAGDLLEADNAYFTNNESQSSFSELCESDVTAASRPNEMTRPSRAHSKTVGGISVPAMCFSFSG